jgi:hypothetical protein
MVNDRELHRVTIRLPQNPGKTVKRLQQEVKV